MTLPLADIRVLSLEQFGAGPWGTLQLADLGAEVIKIEDPSVGGDVARYMQPLQTGSDSVYFESFNRGKHSVTLDLKNDTGRAVFEDLVRHSDALLSNLRGDQPARLRITYKHLAPLNPRIVCVSLSGYGTTGPRASEGAYDATIQALAGWMSVTGGPDEPPTRSGLSLVDFAGGYVAALATVAGIWRARRDGVGGDADLSLFETALAQLNYMGAWAATGGWKHRRMPESAHQSVIPFQAFRASDGFIVVAGAKDSLWKKFCDAIERPDLAEDPAYANAGARDQARDALLPVLREVMLRRTVSDWSERMRRHGVPSAPIKAIDDALIDEQTVARGSVIEYDHPTLGHVRMTGSPFGEGLTGGVARRGPLLGEHTAEILRRVCGYDDTRLAEVGRYGAFGDPAGAHHPARSQ
jgi:crotonobetainyl-CoA:carnitine CoA-transferase CaiB-like acyl-CoA transferase